ncbi:MAG: hypothetical protein Q8885_02495 [Candidatus Phytoplasma stylosanthis]|nr:hypothetical protein [Candidatus Phytoplasma stylosanthis]
MKQSNFFQKNGFFIFLLTIFGIVCCVFWFKNQKEKETTPVSLPESILESLKPYEEKSIPPRMKRYTKTILPKIKTTTARLEQIKNYLFTEPSDHNFLPSDLLEREKEKITELKKSWKEKLENLENRKLKKYINEYQKIYDKNQSQLNFLLPQIESFKKQTKILEEQLEIKQSEIDRLKIDKKDKEDEIKKLQDKKQVIFEEFRQIEIKIGKLESDKKYYQDMLTHVEDLKKDSEKSYERIEKEYKNLILFELDPLYEITSAEG